MGFLQHWNAGHCCSKAAEEGWNDVAFIEAAINKTCRQYAIDKRRIYMMGFSNESMMTYRFPASFTAEHRRISRSGICRLLNARFRF